MKGEPTRNQAAVGIDPFWLYPARIVDRRVEVESVVTLDLEFVDERTRDAYRFLPGQFNMLYAHGAGECPISVSSDAAHADTISHTLRIVGQVTHALASLPIGAVIGIRGPFGSCWPLDEAEGKNLLIVAGGIGLPPMRPLIEEVVRRRHQFRRVTILYGAKTVSALMFPDEYDKWRRSDIDVLVTVDWADETWTGLRGRVPDQVTKLRPQGKDYFVFMCGPEIMMDFAARSCLAGEVPASQIFLSLERNMMCAIGHCGRCQFGGSFVCRDGPVLPLPRVEHYLNRTGY